MGTLGNVQMCLEGKKLELQLNDSVMGHGRQIQRNSSLFEATNKTDTSHRE